MRNSNTSPDRRPWLVAVAALGLFCLPARALDPHRAPAQYIRDQWTADQGFPGGAAFTLAGTTDGYLWIGAEKGLVRFDGSAFRLLNHTNTSLPPSPVLGLDGDAEGGLWIRLQSPGVLRYRNNRFEDASSARGREEALVSAMCRGRDGAILLARNTGILRYYAGQLTTLSSRPGVLVISMAESPDGTLWMGTRDGGLYSLTGDRLTRHLDGLPDRKVNAVLPVGEHELWIGTDGGVVRWTGSELTRAGVPASLAHVRTLAMLRDRDGNVWVATAAGLLRSHAGTVATLAAGASGAVNALFEDREGNLWVGGARGIERLRDSAFLTYAPGRPAPENNGPVYVDEEDRTWYGPSGGGLRWVRGTESGHVTAAGLDRDVVYSIAGAPGELWVGRQRGGLTRLRFTGSAASAETYTAARGLARGSIYAVHRDRDGAVWAGTLGGGVSRIRNGTITTFTAADGLASNTVTAIAEGASGAMWFATPNGLSERMHDGWRLYTGSDGLPPGAVNCLFEDAAGTLWVGTAKGLVGLANGRLQAPSGASDALREEILGMAEDRTGWFWIATAGRVLRVRRAALVSGLLADGDVREYGVAEGLPGTEGVKRYLSVVADARGRVWFSLNRGIAAVDPALLARRSVPVPVQVESILADGNPVDLRGPVRIPSARRRITFGFAGLSLSVPERVRFRYTLDDFDHGWSAPAPAHEAGYTNLPPGSYRFRVMASNADGVWNSDAASIAFEIQPALWQAWWFRVAVLLAGGTGVAAVYRYRVYQVTRQLNVRFDERLQERNRIAQELHDTLLQGFLSASMQLHVAVDALPEDETVKPRLARVLELMRGVIDEGRTAVRGLRSTAPLEDNLEQAFSRVGQELDLAQAPAFRVIVQGHPRPLHPITRDEVYRIGREALVNAFRHSGANSVELEMSYTAGRFSVLVRDNGVGIDPEVVRSGRENHWGLVGMRERAERIGARLKVWSRADAGTEVELHVPGHVAFRAETGAGRKTWLTRWWPGPGSRKEQDS